MNTSTGEDLEFDVWDEIRRRIDAFMRSNYKQPTRLYLGKELERELLNHPNILQSWRYTVPSGIKNIRELFGCKLYIVDNDYRYLELE